jgi:hypothetical protein
MTTNTNTNTNSRTQVNAGYEASKFTLGVGITSAALVGIWACTCMVSAVINNGVADVAKGLLGAIGVM